MEAFKKERSSQRRLFTTTANNFDVILNTEKTQESELKSQYRKLKELTSILSRLDSVIKDLMLQSDCKEEELDKELSIALEYKDRWLQLESRYEEILKELSKPERKEIKRNFKLPEIKLKRFDGSIKNWLSFWGQFKKIDLDPNIDLDDKYLYLLQSMEEGTEVYALIESYPPSGTSYKQCVEELQQRYARDELLIEVYVREILSLVLQEKRDLIDLYDKLNAHLRALNTLGVSKCAAFVLPLVESALPTDILRLWERNKSAERKTEGPEKVLDMLMIFLKAEVESVQRIEMAKNTFGKEKEFKEPSASCLLTAIKNNNKTKNKDEIKSKACIWCGKDTHVSIECYKLSKMTIEERREHLKKENACTICLKKGHYFKICKAYIRCYICNRRHTVAMCPGKKDFDTEKREDKPVEKVQTKEAQKTQTTTTNLSSQGSQTLLQTVLVRIKHGSKSLVVRALYDNGSQRTYIKEDIAKKLGINSVKKEDLQHCLFGGVMMESKKHNVYNITVESLDEKYKMEMQAIGQDEICGYIHRLQLDKTMNEMLRKHRICLSDIEHGNNEIQLLIGADFSGLFMTSGVVHLENSMVAINTKLGWTVQGRQVGTCNNTVTAMLNFTDLWSLEMLGIRDPAELKTKNQQEAEILTSFEKTVKREEDGRYEVQLPFKVGHEDLQPNYQRVKQRLLSTTKKLVTCGNYNEYDSVFKEWQALKIIETVPPDQQCITGHFLPHKPVIKEASLTSAIRPVFDASAPDDNGLCLNSCLEKGLNFIDNIPNLIIGFRKGAIGVTADIAKAFLQVSLPPDNRNYLKFLWWADESLQQVVMYRHCRVVFGLTCSPFLLAATLKHHLNLEAGEYQETAQLLQKSFYVDNCLTSLETQMETHKFIKEAKNIMKAAQFDLRMWVTAPMQINEAGKKTISVLGLNWDTDTDELSCNMVGLSLSPPSKLTKRVVLSLTQKIFDPVGLTCPVSLPPKLLLQEIWKRGLTWDVPLPEDLKVEFNKWYVHLHYLQQYKVPRRLTQDKIHECNLSLHMFSDASKSAMGVCILLRAQKGNKTTVQLVAAKSRVAPPKNISIPRLELMAAVIGVRLLVETRKSLQLPNCKEYCWTDSSVVIYWICKDLVWNTFVGNRVREIKESTRTENWRHIPGTLNWADLASRGCNAKQLLELCWAQGPPFLLSSSAEWPQSTITVDEKEANKELKKVPHNVGVCTNGGLSDKFTYFSKYSKIVRMVAWMLRFVKKENRTFGKEITGKEFEEAEKRIMRLIQQENSDSLEQSLKNLNTFTDNENIMRLKTKLLLSSVPENFKCPIIIPAKNKIVQAMVQQRHVQLQHAGTNLLIADIRKNFWLIGIRKLVKSVIANCMVCRKYKAKPIQAPTAPLPTDRIESSTPFEVSGVDLAGPLFLKNGEKCWIVLFTCAVYRAIHLELTPSLSTEAFIRALRRFIARRGRVRIIYSDNGTNFIGTKNLFEAIDWDEVQKVTCIEKIQWKLNAPTAAWWGGFWERLIRSIKDLLRRVLGKACVSWDEIQTLLCECESILNTRPLTYIQDDKAEALEPLSPACFLQPLISTDTTDLDLIDEKSLNTRHKYLLKLRDDFRQRFRSEYLTELVQRGKKKDKYEEVREGQVVLLESEGKRIKWPLGLVTKIFKGKDGVYRSAEVKTSAGIKIRPVQKLYFLEMSTSESGNLRHINQQVKDKVNRVHVVDDEHDINQQVQDEVNKVTVIDQEKERVTRCGRKVRLPRGCYGTHLV